MDKSLRYTVLALLLLFLLLEITHIDLWFQDQFFNFQTGTWLIPYKAFWPHTIFYKGLKAIVWVIGLTALTLSILPEQTRKKIIRVHLRRVDLIVLVTTLAAAPLLVATSKAVTNVFTPAQIRRYGGDAPYVRPLESYPQHDKPHKRGRAFPAGHASGGFALMALAGLASTRRMRTIGVLTGLGFGLSMGFYQIANGNHYLSHTVYTGLICWIVFLLARRAWGATRSDRAIRTCQSAP